LSSVDKRLCIKDNVSATVQTASIATYSTVVLTVSVSFFVAGIKASSPMGVWSLFNQFQLIIILSLLKTYIPLDVNEYIQQQDFALLDFSFIPFDRIPYLYYPTECFNFKQTDEKLFNIGFEWRSSFNNLYSVFIILTIAVVFHALLGALPN
jgi:hypothetical protein